MCKFVTIFFPFTLLLQIAFVVIFAFTIALFIIWLTQNRFYAKARLLDSGACIDLAVQAAELGVWSWDIVGDSIEMTEFGQILHGRAFDSRVNYRTWLITMHSEDQAPFHQAIQHALAEKTNYRNEYRVIRPDGNVRWIAIQGRGFFDGAGNPVRLMGVLFDITAQKQAEQALRNQDQILAHITRTATLGELSAALVHELNQPLTAILCNSQAGLRFLAQAPPDAEELHNILTDIVEADRRAGVMVSRLRGLFKKEPTEQQLLNINTLIEEVVELLHSELIVKQVCLHLDLTADLPQIMVDPVHIRQLLLNLIMNGAEAMMAVASKPRNLLISTNLLDANRLVVAVYDTGPGVAPKILEQIFEPFVTNKVNGLGMGLAISRTIVTAHGGELWADNSPDSGAVLRFTLPIIQAFKS